MKRRRQEERMDQPGLDAVSHRAALHALSRSNHVLGADRAVVQAIVRATQSVNSVLDLGCGRGAILERVSTWRGTKTIGIDCSPFAVGVAARSNPSGRWLVGDARQVPLADNSVDVAVCTLLVHHFDLDEAKRLLLEAARVARHAVIVSDLTRSMPALLCTWIFTRLFSRSWVFRTDGPRSVRAAYTPQEMKALTEKAGLAGATVRIQFPFRMLVVWKKPSSQSGE